MRLSAGTVIHAQAVLFDMDGTLIDSTAIVERLWHGWAERHGVDAAAILRVSHGVRMMETLRRFTPAGVDINAEAAWLAAREMAERTGIVAVPGAAALLAALPRDRWAVVTSATRDLAVLRFQLAGLPVPETLVSAEDVAASKPEPEGYLRAARTLGVDARACVVIEDAPAGFAAGHAAGARVIALATTLAPEELDAEEWLPDLRPLRVTATGLDLLLEV